MQKRREMRLASTKDTKSLRSGKYKRNIIYPNSTTITYSLPHLSQEFLFLKQTLKNIIIPMEKIRKLYQSLRDFSKTTLLLGGKVMNQIKVKNPCLIRH